MNVLFVIDVQNDFCEGGALACTGGKDIVPKINQLMENRKFDLIIASQDWHPADHISFADNNGKQPFETLKYLPKVQRFNDGTYREVKGEVEQTMCPRHCVAGTQGADFFNKAFFERAELTVCSVAPSDRERYDIEIDEKGFEHFYYKRDPNSVLHSEKFNLIVRKGMNPQIDSYSAFGDNPVELQNGKLLKNSTGLHYLITDMLKNRDAIDFYVTGIATDVCVKATVRDLLDLIQEDRQRCEDEYGLAVDSGDAIYDLAYGDHKVIVLKDMCVGVTQEGHEKALEEMGGWGCEIR